jgi:hypothetical protein
MKTRRKLSDEELDRLEELREEIQRAVGEVRDLLRGTSEDAHADAYWLAALECALGGEHGYLSRDANLAEAIERLRHEDDEEEDD